MERSYVNIKDLENEPEKMIVCRKISLHNLFHCILSVIWIPKYVSKRKKRVGKFSFKKRLGSHLKQGVSVLIGCWFLQLQKNCKQLNAFIFSLIKQTLNRASWNYSRNTERAQFVEGVCT